MLEQEAMGESFFNLQFGFFRFVDDRRNELVLFIPIAVDFCRHTLSSSFLFCLFDHRSLFMEIFLVFFTFFVHFLLIYHFSLRFKQFVVFSSKLFQLNTFILADWIVIPLEFFKHRINNWKRIIRLWFEQCIDNLFQNVLDISGQVLFRFFFLCYPFIHT